MSTVISLGVITFNCLTLLTKDTMILGGIVFLVMFIGTIMPLTVIEETPEYMLYRRDSKQYVELVERYRDLNRISNSEIEKARFGRAVTDHMTLLDTIGTPKKDINRKFYKVVKLSNYTYDIITLSLVGGFMNTTMSSIVLNLGILSFSDISYNGIALGIIGLLSNIILAPILKKMYRKKWLIIFQITLLVCGLSLLLIYKLTSRTSDIFHYTNSIIAVVIVGAVVNAMFVPYYYYVSELFPVDLRGTANSIILCVASLIPVATPWLCLMAQQLDIHFLVGSCLVGLLSTPLTFFLRETHNVDK